MKIYRLYGIETAINFLRPGAVYEYSSENGGTIDWHDERPCPTIQEINETLVKIKNFEDSLKTIWTFEQQEQFRELGIVDFLPPLDHYILYRDYFETRKNLNNNENE